MVLAGHWQYRLVAGIIGESLVVLAGCWQYRLVAGIIGESLVVLAGRWRVVGGIGGSLVVLANQVSVGELPVCRCRPSIMILLLVVKRL